MAGGGTTRVAVPVAIAVALLAAVVAYGAVSGSGTVDGPGPDPSQVQLVSADEVLGRAAVAANRHWLVTIAEQVVEAASSGGVLGLGGDRVTEAEQAFLQRLGVRLND